MKIWLIGGTSDSVILATLLVQAKLPCLVTVTTPEAQLLYPKTPFLEVKSGKIQASQIANFLQLYQIGVIIDASHPFAVEISQNVINFTTSNHLPYLRFERPIYEQFDHPKIFELDSFSSLINSNYLLKQRVLLTIGYQNLPLFKTYHSQASLFARILPNLNSLQVALDSGFTNDRLIAFRPPLNLNLERALWQQWQINTVVTKASGKAGGEEIKAILAQELGVTLIIIARPKITYPNQTNDPQKVLSFCRYFLDNLG